MQTSAQRRGSQRTLEGMRMIGGNVSRKGSPESSEQRRSNNVKIEKFVDQEWKSSGEISTARFPAGEENTETEGQ